MAKTSCKKGQYYCNTDKKCKPIPEGYTVREDGFLVKEGWSAKYKKSIDCNNPKGFSQKAHCAGKKKKMTEESNPRIARKKGQPAKSKKHSDLYTDEDPKGTIHGLGFKDVATAKASVAKIRKSGRSHAHKIQAAIAMEQRARVMGKTSEAAVYRKFIDSMKKKTKKMNEEKHGDHEPEMIRSQLKTAGRASKRIEKHSRRKDNFKAWVQSKITKASDYLDTAADYLDGKDDVKEGSLHKWFKGSKSKDGKGGWVNVRTGGTCASDEPGEGVPKCVSRSKYDSMSKKERESAARRKKAADPNQQKKTGAAKPTYVATDKPKKKMKEEFVSLPLQLEVPQSDGEFKLGLMFRESLEQDRGMLFIFESNDYWTFHMKNTFIPLDIAFIKEDGTIDSIEELDPMNPIPVGPDSEIRYAVEVNRGWFAENGVIVGDRLLEEEDLTEGKDKKGKGSGTKDACYHKVKSRYSVWPSAYASGALVKCRKVGAANWGNSTKKEEYVPEQAVLTPIEKHMSQKKRNMDKKPLKRNPKNEHYDWRETLDEMDGKLMPSNPKFKGVGATKKSNPIPERTKGVFTQQKRSYLYDKSTGAEGMKKLKTKMETDAANDKKDLESAKDVMKTNVPAYDSQAKYHSIVQSSKPGQAYNFTRQRSGAINKYTVKTAGKPKTEHYDWREGLIEKKKIDYSEYPELVAQGRGGKTANVDVEPGLLKTYRNVRTVGSLLPAIGKRLIGDKDAFKKQEKAERKRYKNPQGIERVVTGIADKMTGDKYDFDRKGPSKTKKEDYSWIDPLDEQALNMAQRRAARGSSYKAPAPKPQPKPAPQAAPAPQAKPATPAPQAKPVLSNKSPAAKSGIPLSTRQAAADRNAKFQAAKKSGNLKQFRADNPKMSGTDRAKAMARARIASKRAESSAPKAPRPTVDKVPPAAQTKPAPQTPQEKPTANTVTKPAPQQAPKGQDALNRRTTPQKPQDALNRNPGQKPVGTPASASKKIDGAGLANKMRAQNSQSGGAVKTAQAPQSGNTSSSSSRTIGVDPSPGRSDTKSLVNNNKSQNVQNAKNVTKQMNQVNQQTKDFEIDDYNNIPVKNSKGKTVKKIPGANAMPSGGSNKSMNQSMSDF